MATKMDVNFEDDIPTIKREGGKRGSKYGELLDKIRDRAQKVKSKKVAVMVFDTQGKATSRYTSIKDAVSKREDEAHWSVAVRNVEGEFRLYIKWHDEPQADESADEGDA